jgi:hypothetical protein
VATSQNGYPVLFANGTSGPLPRLRKWIVPDSNTFVYLRDGSTGFVLTWIAAWWDENIRQIDLGIFDDWGWNVRPVRGQTSGYSNHSSGTAIDVDATRHPRGVEVGKNLTAEQISKIHDMLGYLERVIRWGGDYNSTVDAMHFEVNAPLDALERVALKVADTKRGQAILKANPGAWAVISSGTSAQGKPQPGTVVTPPKPEPKPEPAPEPPAPPVPTKPPHDPFTVGLLPGRWDAPLKAWLDRHREVRDQAAQIVTLTEGTRPALVEDFTRALNQIAGEGPLFWEVYHDPTPGPANIIHTWDGNRFEQVGIPWKVQLDTIQIWSKKGFARPNTYAVGIALRDKQADKVILLVGAHLPLENTVRRRKAKEEALAVLKDKAFDSGREQFPDSVRMFACDWNRRAHKQTVRDWFKATWPGLAASWATRAVRTQGPDWVAAGTRLVNLESVVLPRTKGDPLDHTTKVTRWGWR